MVPTFAPASAGGRLLGNLRPVRPVDDENLIAMVVGLAAQMDVIEMARVLVAEEQANILVRILLGRALGIDGESEIGHDDVLEQTQPEGAAKRRLRLAELGETIGRAAIGLDHFPGRRIARLPARRPVGKIVVDRDGVALRSFTLRSVALRSVALRSVARRRNEQRRPEQRRPEQQRRERRRDCESSDRKLRLPSHSAISLVPKDDPMMPRLHYERAAADQASIRRFTIGCGKVSWRRSCHGLAKSSSRSA